MAVPLESVVCILCEESSEQPAGPEAVIATHSPDLDLRPSGVARRQLARWVQQCPHCGYCNAALDSLPDSLPLDSVRQLVATDKYAATVRDPRYPELARRFRAQALLQASATDSAASDLAALSLLYAAWACDDAADDPPDGIPAVQAEALARGLRRNAAEQLRAAVEAGRAPVVDSVTSWLVLTDCYRRAEVFPSAHTASIRGLAAAGDGEDSASAVMRGLLKFEQELIEAQETGAVNMAQAFEAEP